MSKMATFAENIFTMRRSDLLQQPHIAAATWIAIAMLALTALIMGAFTPLTGDDVGYGPITASLYCDSAGGYLMWMLRHVWLVNGRLANLAAPLWLWHMPHWILLTINALMVGWFYLMTVWCCRLPRRSALAQLIVIAVVAFAFPWWDSTWIFDVSMNYVWTSAIGLCFMAIYLYGEDLDRPAVMVGAMLLSVVAGAMHEAFSMATLLGIVSQRIVSGEKMSAGKRTMAFSFAAGTALAFLSPGIWRRALGLSMNLPPDDPMWLILLKSDALVLIMIIWIVVLLIVDRDKLRKILRSKTIVWIVAAIASMCFSAVGGIVGRSGWFANLFALIAMVDLCRPLPNMRPMVAGTVATILFGALTFNLFEVCRWQLRVGKEFQDVVTQYIESEDGVVFYDVTDLSDTPVWLLGRVRCVPDADDFYILEMLQRQYGATGPLLLMPKEAEGVTPDQVGQRLNVRRGYLTTDSVPTIYETVVDNGRADSTVVTHHRYSTPISYVTQRHLNPGDRLGKP